LYIYDNISLNSSKNEKCFRPKLWRKSKHIFYVQYFFNRKWWRLGDNMERYGRAGQVTDDNIIRRMHVAFWISKATNTHSEFEILFAVPLQLVA
jgi:hypothetical protein